MCNPGHYSSSLLFSKRLNVDNHCQCKDGDDAFDDDNDDDDDDDDEGDARDDNDNDDNHDGDYIMVVMVIIAEMIMTMMFAAVTDEDGDC